MAVSTVIELKGHIIDSLTLAKVIDLIQTSHAQYKMNFIDVGYGKTDFSTAHITISLPTQEALDALLKDLTTYGAKPIETESPDYLPAPADGTLPENALLIERSLKRVFIDDEWRPLQCADQANTVIVFDPQTQIACLKSQPNVKKDELVVISPPDIPNHLLLK